MPYIYIIKNDLYYKIGYTKNIENRLRELQTANSSKLQLVESFYTNSPKKDEDYLLKTFKNKKKRGEWFNLSGNDIIFIQDYFNKISINKELSKKASIIKKYRNLENFKDKTEEEIVQAFLIGQIKKYLTSHILNKNEAKLVNNKILHYSTEYKFNNYNTMDCFKDIIFTELLKYRIEKNLSETHKYIDNRSIKTLRELDGRLYELKRQLKTILLD